MSSIKKEDTLYKEISISDSYFRCVQSKTLTQFWINSARLADLGLALQLGAVGNTTNPTHIPVAIKTDAEIWYPVIDEILCLNKNLFDDEIADLITQRIQDRTAKMLEPLFEISNGKYGYVAIQGNPYCNDNLEEVIDKAIEYSKLRKNIAVKIVSTEVGMKAIEELTARGITTIATKGFSVAQAINAAEAYERGLKRTDKKPKCFVVHIAGIFDEYLTEVAEKEGVEINPSLIEKAGVVITRKIYNIFLERKFKAILLAGGARLPHHFTKLVGGDIAITISLNTVKDLLLENPNVVSEIGDEIDERILSELENKFIDFRRAYYPDGLTIDKFRNFGPCVKFQNSCLKAYDETLVEIRARRKKL